MKIKYKNIEAEVEAEDIAKKIIDNNEKNWQEKFSSKTTAKKELLKLKHQNKMEEQLLKKMNEKDLKKYYHNQNLNKENKELYQQEKSQKTFKILSIIMFFIYGLFCILGFQNHHIISAIISLIQLLLTIISLFISMKFFSFFKEDYKFFLILSILLIIPWLMFAI